MNWNSIAVVAVVTVGCVENSPGVCEVGARRACESCEDEQLCRGEPPAWSPCECELPSLGAECQRDGDCRGDAICVNAFSTTFLGGGPPNGLCALDCSSDGTLCDEHGALCVQTDGLSTDSADDDVALCLTQCGSGSGEECAERPGMVCDSRLVPLTSSGSNVSTGICRPLCVVNEDCGNGLVCDRATGACTEEPRQGSPFGAPCDPAEAEACEGLCVAFNDDEEGLCSHACPYQAPGDETAWCSFNGARPTGVCAWPLSSGAASNDAALCAPLCEVDADCESEDWYCGAYASGVATGICLPGPRVSPGPRESSDGGTSEPERSRDAGAGIFDPRDAGFDSDAARGDGLEQVVDAALDGGEAGR